MHRHRILAGIDIMDVDTGLLEIIKNRQRHGFVFGKTLGDSILGVILTATLQ
jgi:hypothetical protein